MPIIEEFKKFAIRGNVVDLAVGIMVGSAFTQIVTSLVNDMVMPPIGYLIGGIKFDDYKIVLKPAQTDPSGKVVANAVTINYGTFIEVVIHFLIIAFIIFLLVRFINKMRDRMQSRKAQQSPPPPESGAAQAP